MPNTPLKTSFPPEPPRLQTVRLRACIDLVEVSRGLQVLARPARSEAVRIIQAALRSLGIMSGRADGAFGPATVNAIRQFQRSQGLRALGRIDAPTLLALDHVLDSASSQAPTASSPLDVLHSAPAHSSAYRQAIAACREDEPIWPQLRTLGAREALIRHLVAIDATELRNYYSFDNLCTGFSVQVYARFSARANLDAAARVHLQKVAIDAKPAAAKFRVPAFVVMSDNHAFNAFLVDEEAPDKLSSYQMLEPQNDAFITQGTSSWQIYVERFGVILFDVAGCDASGRFDLRPVRCFAADGQRRMTSVRSVKVVRFLRDLRIAESVLTNYRYYVVDQPPPRRGFVNFIRHQAKNVWKLSDAELVEAGRLVIGCSLRSHPERDLTLMTADHYVALLNRADLRGSLPGSRTAVELARL